MTRKDAKSRILAFLKLLLNVRNCIIILILLYYFSPGIKAALEAVTWVMVAFPVLQVQRVSFASGHPPTWTKNRIRIRQKPVRPESVITAAQSSASSIERWDQTSSWGKPYERQWLARTENGQGSIPAIGNKISWRDLWRNLQTHLYKLTCFHNSN